LIWPSSFAERLEQWNSLRINCQTVSVKTALENINSWWFQTPWQPYYLHWDDRPTWPDPWQLLNDNVYCDLARALGILYTVTMLDRADMADAKLVLTQDGCNLVLVAKEKYILNWEPDSIVNTFQAVKIKQQYQQHQII
jgi:hypothetical protein